MNNKLHKNTLYFTLFIMLIGSFLLSACSSTQAAPQVRRVGILAGNEFFAASKDGFMAGMKDLGYVEGENIAYNIQEINAGDAAKTEAALKKFVDDQVDLIYVYPTGSVIAAKKAVEGTDIPIVFTGVTLQGTDLVESVSQPGGNITGIQSPSPDLHLKRLEFLLKMTPDAKRVLALHNPTYSASVAFLETLEEKTPAFGIELEVVPVTTIDEIVAGLQELEDSGQVDSLDAILIMPEIIVQTPEGWKLLTDFADKYQLPIGGSLPKNFKEGAVFSYFPDNFETGQVAASMTDKIFKGTPAGTIPVQSPEPRLRINYKHAQALGLTVDEGLLGLATEVIR